MFGLEPDLAPRCVESASFRATALRVATADPPDPGSLPLRQELAQLRAEGLRGDWGEKGEGGRPPRHITPRGVATTLRADL